MNTAKQFGGALGLAALVSDTATPLNTSEAITSGYDWAFLAIAAILGVVALTARALPAGRDASGRARAET